jgi:6-phosphogluconolactonase
VTVHGAELVLVADADEAAQFVSAELAAAARAGQAIVLTGGTTPGHAYTLAAEAEPDWSGAALWWGDDRAVPPDDERSNFGLARASLLDRLSAQPREVHRILGELGAEAAAAEYDAELENAQFGLVLLGVGSDGHTASLFPDQPTLDERSRRAIPAEAKLEPFVDRVTLTVPALCSAPEVLFLVTGEQKAEAVERAFGRPPDPGTPASLIRSAGGRTRLVADAAAASRLDA